MAYTPAEEPSPGTPIFPVMLGLMMLGGLALAIFVSTLKDEPTAAAATAAVTPAAPATTAAPAVDDKLAGRIDGLDDQLKALQAKIDAQSKSKSEPPPDLKPIQSKLADLGKSVASVNGVADKVGQFESRLAALDGAVKSANDKVAALADEVKNVVADSKKTATPPAAVAVEPTKPADSGAALGDAATLDKAAKYKEADEARKKLVAANPKDARVYYYAALTHGLTTSDWQGEALKIAAKGAELEKSGVSKAADIDAAFTGLPDNLKPWLAFYRKAAQP